MQNLVYGEKVLTQTRRNQGTEGNASLEISKLMKKDHRTMKKCLSVGLLRIQNQRH